MSDRLKMKCEPLKTSDHVRLTITDTAKGTTIVRELNEAGREDWHSVLCVFVSHINELHERVAKLESPDDT